AAAVACDRGPESAASHRRSRPPHGRADAEDRKSTRLNSSHVSISYAVFCLKKKNLSKVQTDFLSKDISKISQHNIAHRPLLIYLTYANKSLISTITYLITEHIPAIVNTLQL